MARVFVSGSLAYDRIMVFPGLFKDHFLPEKLHSINVSFQVDTVAENFGGCAGNIAYNLSLLDIDSAILATAGTDYARYRKHFETLRTDMTSIRVSDSAPTSTAYMMTDKGDNQIAAFSMGAGETPYEPLPDTRSASCALIAAGNIADMRALPTHYRAKGTPFFFDPAQALTALSADDIVNGLDGAEAVFGNDYEFALVTENTGLDEGAILEKAKALVITLGEKGARVVTREGEKHIEAVPVEHAIDPTGAGDAFRAGYLAGYLRRLPPETCAALGATVAAYAVEKYGTQNHTFTKSDLKKRHEATYGGAFPL